MNKEKLTDEYEYEYEWILGAPKPQWLKDLIRAKEIQIEKLDEVNYQVIEPIEEIVIRAEKGEKLIVEDMIEGESIYRRVYIE